MGIFSKPVSPEEQARRLAIRSGGFITQRRLNEILDTASMAIMASAQEKAALDARNREVTPP